MASRNIGTPVRRAFAHIYVRVSTGGQSTDGQQARLEHERDNFLTFGTHIEGENFIEVCSAFGERAAHRPEWNNMLRSVGRGDIVFVERSDRLGRAYGVIDELDRLTTRGVIIRIVAIDSTYQRSRELVIAQLEMAIHESTALQARSNDNIRYQRANGGHIGPMPMGYISEITAGIRNKVPNMPLIYEINAFANTARATRRSPDIHAAMMLANMHIDAVANDLPDIATDIITHVSQQRMDISPTIIRRILNIPHGQCTECNHTDTNVHSCAGCFCKMHWRCIAPHTHEARGHWYCHNCILEGNAPLLACNICDDGHMTDSNLIMICDRCTLGFHEHCVGIPNDPTDDTWMCPLCT